MLGAIDPAERALVDAHLRLRRLPQRAGRPADFQALLALVSAEEAVGEGGVDWTRGSGGASRAGGDEAAPARAGALATVHDLQSRPPPAAGRVRSAP